MDSRDIVLASLASSKGRCYRPVQVQKLLFLIDRNIGNGIGGPFFKFQPYNYGPFDKTVYDVLESLAEEGYVEIVRESTWKNYRLTIAGQKKGEALLDTMTDEVRAYIQVISSWVLSLSFTQLVSAIYKAYPDMRANSVFQD
jgi:uncharacterized protein